VQCAPCAGIIKRIKNRRAGTPNTHTKQSVSEHTTHQGWAGLKLLPLQLRPCKRRWMLPLLGRRHNGGARGACGRRRRGCFGHTLVAGACVHCIQHPLNLVVGLAFGEPLVAGEQRGCLGAQVAHPHLCQVPACSHTSVYACMRCVRWSVCLSVSICPSIRLFISVCLSICLSTTQTCTGSV